MNERHIPIFGQTHLRVSLEAGGAGAVPTAAAYLGALEANLRGDPAVLLEQVAAVMRRSFRRNFESGGRPAWRPLQPGTVARKQAAFGAGRIPRRTPSGRIPRRLTQVDRQTGQKGFSGFTILIANGTLRDSWCVKGARGNVTHIDGDALFVGSQLTLDRVLPVDKPVRHYHILTKKAQKERGQGKAVPAKVPVARFHEEGAPNAHIPARPVGVLQTEDVAAIQAAALEWMRGNT